MKKFLQEFKEFALKGNVMDMAVGVIVGGAFSSIVSALTDNILNPIIACLGGTEIGLVTPLGNTGQVIDWGAFISAIINFLILALVLFTILKAVNNLAALTKKKEEEEAEAAPEPEPSEEVKLLTSIAEELKKLNKK
ncbi:MAG: large conductance mechanosensitive channel protein MscL [Erysipelotrichaceae bacterium]|jgi:large conductance mechanosensitive channel|nr:large conductance mechanosensitive channel protein MscL [Erysipelotrichaceae bacterium]